MLKLRISKNRKNLSQEVYLTIGEMLPRIESNKDQIERERTIKEDIAKLLDMYPGSPSFLGKNILYSGSSKRLFFFSKRLPDLTEIRKFVSKPDESKDGTIRLKIKKLVKRYQYSPEIHALNAIQVFNDTFMSGLEGKRLIVMKESLIEITNALYNDGASIFNVTWFIKIYLKYLESLNKKYIHAYNIISKQCLHNTKDVSYDLYGKKMQTLILLTVRNRLGGLTQLNQKLKGSRFFREGIQPKEIRDACRAILHNDKNRMISEGKSAKYIFWIVISMNLLFANIPILKDLTKNTMRHVPNLNRDIILQKAMVITMLSLTDFRLAFACGDELSARSKAADLFRRCVELISLYLEYSILTKPYEIDPFIKAAWIVKESQGLFPKNEYRAMIEKAIEILDVVKGKRGKGRGLSEQTNLLNKELLEIKRHHGWMN